VINVSMLLIAASCCQGDRAVALTLQRASAAVSGHVGSGVALLFAIGLLASGFASTGVGTLAGQSIMSGFLARSVPLPVRRLVTLLPPVVVLALGVDGTQALVASQVVLSMGVPFALVPLIWFTRRPELMGPLVNRRSTTAVAWACAALVVTVNVALVLSLLGVL
jgi:manganese transport protein